MNLLDGKMVREKIIDDIKNKLIDIDKNLKIVVMIIFLASPFNKCSRRSPENAFSRLGISEALNVAVICVSKSMRSSTISTVGLLRHFVIRNFWAAKTIRRDLPLP